MYGPAAPDLLRGVAGELEWLEHHEFGDDGNRQLRAACSDALLPQLTLDVMDAYFKFALRAQSLSLAQRGCGP